MRLAAILARALVAAGLLAATPAAEAQGRPCAERATVIERLHDRFGETRRSIGLNRENVVEVFASAETGTWTILITTPNGMSCLLASGEMWEGNAPLAALGKDA